jgi:predicted metal-dependent phosphoesterase TrpH
VIDLHTHSIYSDGTNSPTELLKMAEKRGLRALALTDHDTVAGIAELLAAGKESKVEPIPGIELSAACENGTMHILGYFIDPASPALAEMLTKVRAGRTARNLEILKKLNRLGYILRWSDLEEYTGKDVVGRPHFAEVLVKRGHVKSKKAAFDLLLAKGRPAYAERYHCTATECIGYIRAAGGIAVLAHPATIHLSDPKLRSLVGELAKQGLGGIEVYYAEHRPENRKKFIGWAKELGLLCTGGSDFHGENSPDLKLGTGFGQLHVPDEALEELKAQVQASLREPIERSS